MKVLFLSPRQCWPPRTGAKLREYHLAKSLSRLASVTHVSFAQDDAPPMSGSDMPFCAELIQAPPPPRYTLRKIVQGLFGSTPLPLLNYRSDDMSAVLRAILEQGRFDAIHLESIHMATYLPLIEGLTHAPLILDWHNIESEAMSRYAAGAPTAAHAMYARVTATQLLRAEDFALGRAAGHIVCSAREAQKLKARRPEAEIEVVENGVDTQAFSGSATPVGERDSLVFVGSMNYSPNVDGVTYFAREIWPIVRRRFPSWRFVIVGSDPGSSVRKLAAQPGIEVTGPVDDVGEYYRNAVAAVVPLRMGGGTRLKILEAMAAGTPVISTALGAEGIDVTPGTDMLAAEKPEEWLDALELLAESEERWLELSCAGRRLVCSRYDWDVIGEKLLQTYGEWLGEGATKHEYRRRS